MITGSWLNANTKSKPNNENESPKSKSRSVTKHLIQSDKIKIPNMTMHKKMANSYSRFLSSGLVYATSSGD